MGVILVGSLFHRLFRLSYSKRKRGYRKVENGRVTNTIEYVTADQEEGYLIAQANNPLDEPGNFTTSRVTAREKGEFIEVDPADVHYICLLYTSTFLINILYMNPLYLRHKAEKMFMFSLTSRI